MNILNKNIVLISTVFMLSLNKMCTKCIDLFINYQGFVFKLTHNIITYFSYLYLDLNTS